MRMLARLVFVFFLFLASCVTEPQFMPTHLRANSGIFPHVVTQVHNEVSLGVMVRVTNDRPHAYFVVLRCTFNTGGRELSVNEVVLNRMAPYEVIETYVGSSRWTRFDTRIVCEITDESSPVP